MEKAPLERKGFSEYPAKTPLKKLDTWNIFMLKEFG